MLYLLLYLSLTSFFLNAIILLSISIFRVSLVVEQASLSGPSLPLLLYSSLAALSLLSHVLRSNHFLIGTVQNIELSSKYTVLLIKPYKKKFTCALAMTHISTFATFLAVAHCPAPLSSLNVSPIENLLNNGGASVCSRFLQQVSCPALSLEPTYARAQLSLRIFD